MDTRIYLFLVATISIAHVSNPDEGGMLKQRRLFNRINSNWPITIGSETASDDAMFDELENPNVARLKFLQNILRPRQQSEFDENNYALHYDGERELESSLPYGIQNVMDGTNARAPRSKNWNQKPITYQSLCPSRRETVFLNMDLDFEYRPDHYEEVLCANKPLPHENLIPAAVCNEAGFSCIQLNRTLFLTRRPRGESCWESETRLVAAGCKCMWPKHHLGDIVAHH